MKKRVLLIAALVAISTVGAGTANAVDVSSWSELNTAENIKFAGDIQASGEPQTISINSQNNSQTIDGGQYSLTGASGYRILIDNRSELIIKNLGKLVDGTAENHTFSYTDAGGNTVYKTISGSVNGFNKSPIQAYSAILPKLTVSDVVYTNNDGRLLDVWLDEHTDKATLKNIVLYGNTINSGSLSDSLIGISVGTVEIDNLIADSNVGRNGDNILTFALGTNTKIKNSIFQNNKTDEFGVLQLSGGFVEIDNSQFINNSMVWDGAAISVTSTMGNVTNTIFKNNSVSYGNGGAIWYAQLASSPYFYNTKFEANKATASGSAGGAMLIGGTGQSTGSVYILESDFKENEASYGGGIYSYNTTGFYVVDTNFTENKAQEGGAIYAADENLNIFANTKDVTFNGNIATNTTDTYNGGAAVYYEYSDNSLDVAMNVNAASKRKVIFNDSVAAYGDGATLNVNKSGLSYDDIEGNSVKVTNSGEIQFNDRVGDKEGNIFNINLYGGTLSIGQNEDESAPATNPDGYINDNNFNVLGDSTLNTVNGVIGEFAPKAFVIANGVNLDYQMDVDLVNKKSDTLNVSAQDGSIENNGTLSLAAFNIFSDSTEQNLKIKYSDTNVGGVLKDGYTIITSTETYNVSTLNDDTGSYVIFSQVLPLGGLPNAIYTQANQYAITNGEDENVTAWAEDEGNVIKKDIDINGNGQSIYTEDGLDGMVVSQGTSVVLRNIDELSGFKNALTNNGGTLTVTDTNVTGNSGNADITNNGGTVTINANTKDVTIGSEDTTNAITSKGGTISIKGQDDHTVTIDGNLVASNSATINVDTDTTFNGNVTISDESSKMNINADAQIDTLTNSGTVDNQGTLTVKGGENNGTISGDDGETTIDGEFTNNSEISQKSVTVSDQTTEEKPFTNNGEVTADNFTNNGYTDNGENGTITADTIINEGTLITNASNLSSTNGKPVTNNGELEFTSGTNNNDIEGDGETVVSGAVENVANINNDVTVNSDGTLNNNGGSLGGAGKTVTNDGTIANDGNITGTAVNNGALTNDGNVEGEVVNNNIINNNLSIDGDVTNNGNGKIANSAGASITGGMDNKGVVDNDGNIISTNGKSIENSGTINNTGDLNGKINNTQDGVINTTVKGLDGVITNNGNIHYTTGGSMENDISGDGVVHLDGNGTAVLNSDLGGNTLSLNNGTLVFGSNKDISQGGFIGNGGAIGNVLDGKTLTYKLGNANLVKDTKVDGIDFDLNNLTSDKFIANFTGNGKLNIDKVQVKGNTLKDSIRVYLGDTTKVDKNHLNVKNQKLPTIMTPIRRLAGRVEDNYLTYAGTGNSAKDFNPAILASPVATLIGGQITQSQTLQDSFFHMNRYMKYSSNARIASEARNKYALSELHPYPTYVRSSLPETSQAMWVKPYTTFEKVHLKGGVGVSNTAYGALYGGDTDLVNLGHGYKGVISAFVGYNGSHQSYNGISMNQQGGTLGVTGTLYHGNFFTGLTLSAGASAGEAHTPFGTDHFTMLTAGIANKTGYNIELADGKFIIQPSLYLGYTFVNNFDYKNSAGVNIDSDPLSTIQIAPGIKFIGNLKNGWQPYAGVDMMWNIMGRTKFKAADSRLPELSVKPYVQYGVGLQKSWSDRFTAFFQTMLRNGGRTGIVLEGGFRWTFGGSKKPQTKAQEKNNNIGNKKVIKSLKTASTNIQNR